MMANILHDRCIIYCSILVVNQNTHYEQSPNICIIAEFTHTHIRNQHDINMYTCSTLYAVGCWYARVPLRKQKELQYKRDVYLWAGEITLLYSEIFSIVVKYYFATTNHKRSINCK